LSIFIPLKTGLGCLPKSATDFKFVVLQKTFLFAPKSGFEKGCFGLDKWPCECCIAIYKGVSPPLLHEEFWYYIGFSLKLSLFIFLIFSALEGSLLTDWFV